MSAEKPTFEVVFWPTKQAVEAKLPWPSIVDIGNHAAKRWGELEQQKQRLENSGERVALQASTQK